MNRYGRLLTVGTAAGAGLLLYASAPPRELWWLARVAFALLWTVLHGHRARAGFGYGFAFFLPVMSWVGELVSSLPWLALVAVLALVLAVAGAGVAVVSRMPAAPLWAAGVWVAAEALIARVPFGGFPWGSGGIRPAERGIYPCRRDRRGAATHCGRGADRIRGRRDSPLARAGACTRDPYPKAPSTRGACAVHPGCAGGAGPAAFHYYARYPAGRRAGVGTGGAGPGGGGSGRHAR